MTQNLRRKRLQTKRDRQTNRQTERKKERDRERERDRQTQRETDRQRDRQTDKDRAQELNKLFFQHFVVDQSRPAVLPMKSRRISRGNAVTGLSRFTPFRAVRKAEEQHLLTRINYSVSGDREREKEREREGEAERERVGREGGIEGRKEGGREAMFFLSLCSVFSLHRNSAPDLDNVSSMVLS